VVTNRGWDTNVFLPCGKVIATCGDSAGRQKPHTLTWFCGGSCGLQFMSQPTAYQHRESPHEQTARQCETSNQRFVSKLMMANESSKLFFCVAPCSPLGQHGRRAPSSCRLTVGRYLHTQQAAHKAPVASTCLCARTLRLFHMAL